MSECGREPPVRSTDGNDPQSAIQQDLSAPPHQPFVYSGRVAAVDRSLRKTA